MGQFSQIDRYKKSRQVIGKRSGVVVRLSYIPAGSETSPLDFDKTRMTALFDLGRSHALANEVWEPVER